MGLLFLCLCVSGFGQSGPPPLPPVPLEEWMLDRTNWEGWRQELPLGFTNLNAVPSWLDFALSVDTNTTAYLNLPIYAADGYTNVTFDSGSVSFFCQMNWTSTSDGGAGPGAWAPLWQAGTFSSNNPSGCWSLAVSPDGNTLLFVTQTNGAGEVHAQIPIVWDAGDWHNIVLTYCPTNCAIFLEGALVTNMPPIVYWPGPDVCSNGFYVGSDPTGTLQAHAQFQELETYGVPLDADFIQDNYNEVSGEILAWGGTLPAVGAGGIGVTTQAPGPPILPGMGSGTNGGGGFMPSFPPPTYHTNSATAYDQYTNFWLAVGMSSSNKQAAVTIQNTLSNLTYEILTNSVLDTNLADWGVWQVLTASNSVIVAPPFAIGSNSMFFASQLVLITGTNQIADWWQLKYFGHLGVDPYADPDGDGLCNYSEYILGSNPTNAHSMSASKTDAQYFFLAYTNDSSTRMLLFQSNGPGTNAVTLTLSNTLVGSNYQIYSKDMSVTNGAWRVETNFLGTNTATQITIQLGGRTLAFIGGDGEDPDGDGLPSGYEVLATHTDPLLADTGNTGTPDGYKDPDGDGYVNLVEYQNGTDPLVWDAPAGVQNISVQLVGGTNGNLLATWQPAGGQVLGYIISVDNSNVATNSPSQLSYLAAGVPPLIGVQAIYADGLSSITYSHGTTAMSSVALVNGPGGVPYLVMPQINENVAAIQVSLFSEGTRSYPIDFLGSQRYCQPVHDYPGFGVINTFEVPISYFTNGIAQLTAGEVPPYGDYSATFQIVSTMGIASQDDADYLEDYYAMPFLDASTQMKQNIAFQLRLADTAPFQFYISDTTGTTQFAYPASYAYSDYYFTENAFEEGTYSLVWNHFEPVEDNYFFLNLVYNASLIATNGSLTTGFQPENDYSSLYVANGPLMFNFPTYDYILYSNNVPVPAVLSAAATQWIGYYDEGDLGKLGLPYNPQYGIRLQTNLFGLPYTAELDTIMGSPIQHYVITNGTPGGPPGGQPFFISPTQPVLQTIGYYFARFNVDPTPGYQDGSFTIESATPPLILGSVGQSMVIAGYAKQKIANGYSNMYAYLGQYFTNASVMSNGVPTANAGIVSEYGQFFPMLPGHIGLMTKPDPDQNNAQGTCELDIIRLSLDVNHDGIMDESFNGPDNTSPDRPYVFWANNNYDRWDEDLIDGIQEEDSQNPATTSGPPDCDYAGALGLSGRTIPCPRDLEDFARLWVSGVSNTLSRLPAGSTVTLNWGDASDPDYTNPTIDVFQAADVDGGIGYLTNLTTASNQINNTLCRYVGRLGPGGSLLLNNAAYTNGWAGDHYIFCGVWYGSGALNLTIADGSGNPLAQSSQYIQIQDIKQMYERWTVGDNPGDPPFNLAVRSADHLPYGMKAPFQYPYNAAVDTNDTYILSVHGYNIPLWEAEAFSETMFKRLYWQGYTGRFGEFRWPCRANPLQFDSDEFTSWQSGTGLYHLLVTLNSYYPGNVYLFAHSLGNVAAGQALRMATNVLVNTYIAAQGAVAVHAYDPSTPERTPTLVAAYTTPDCYAKYWTNGAPCYFNGVTGAASYVNFFNTNDWALIRPWPANQDLKPDATFSPLLRYGYDGTDFQSISGLLPATYTYHNLVFPQDTFTIFAYCDQAPCMALGAQMNVNGAFAKSGRAQQLDLAATPYNFGNLHIYHSGEFRSDNMQRWQFWKRTLISYGLKSN
jgi:hypothetical protein